MQIGRKSTQLVDQNGVKKIKYMDAFGPPNFCEHPQLVPSLELI